MESERKGLKNSKSFLSYRQKNKNTSQQLYFNLMEYDWLYGNKEIVRLQQVEQKMEDVRMKAEQKQLDTPVPMIMKLIHTKQKSPKPAKHPKIKLTARRRAEAVDDSQERINQFFNNLFPVVHGEKITGSRKSRYFCIDDASKTGSGTVKCKICLDEFVSTLKLTAHLITHKNLMYKCQYCPLEVAQI